MLHQGDRVLYLVVPFTFIPAVRFHPVLTLNYATFLPSMMRPYRSTHRSSGALIREELIWAGRRTRKTRTANPHRSQPWVKIRHCMRVCPLFKQALLLGPIRTSAHASIQSAIHPTPLGQPTQLVALKGLPGRLVTSQLSLRVLSARPTKAGSL
jgi:hypothetical protein